MNEEPYTGEITNRQIQYISDLKNKRGLKGRGEVARMLRFYGKSCVAALNIREASDMIKVLLEGNFEKVCGVKFV